MQPQPDGNAIPKRIPRTIEDIRSWFFTNVTTTEKGCWEWNGPHNKGSYGTCRVDGKKRMAHRVAFLLANGFLPTDKIVCHECDNNPCVNPAHLFLGNDKINHRDAVSKGRKKDFRGEDSPGAKFTVQQVIEIRKRYNAGDGCRKLGLEFRVHHSTISAIGLRKTWKHIP